METMTRRISVLMEGADNLLTIELEPGETLIPYCCKVMEVTQIPGLLGMHHQTLDGVVTLRYSLSGKVPLRDYMLQHHLSYQNGVLLLRNLSTALLDLNSYFLSTDMCYLDPEQVYIGDGLTAYVPCLPVETKTKGNNAMRLKCFYEKLLSEYFATADCSSYDAMFKWVYKSALFDLKTFCQEFLEESKPTPAPAQPEPPKAEPAVAAVPAQEPAKEKEPSKTAYSRQMKSIQALYPEAKEKVAELIRENEKKTPQNTAGFAIPGAAEPPAERKSRWPFQKTARQEKPASSVGQQEDWDRGTIMADQPPKQESAAPRASGKAWFEHNGSRVDILQTPFIVGKYNSSCKVHYAVYDNNKVSRSHATFLLQEGQYCIRDNQSRNGTTVNGKPLLPLQPLLLHDGDEIRLYDEVLIFHLE